MKKEGFKKMGIVCLIILLIITLLVASYRIISTRFNVKHYKETDNDYVILLHGIGGFSYSMEPLAKELSQKGYTVFNVNYPSTLCDIQTIADLYLDKVIKTYCTDTTRKIHFVTHSMGGIVTRYYLKQNKDSLNLGRVVMLSPPNKGSEIVDVFDSLKIVEYIYGPAFYQLGTDSTGFVHTLGPVDYETGIIMGNKAVFIPGMFIIPGESDGMVAVKRAPVEGMSDFRIIPNSHTFIMLNREVIENVVSFLSFGYFVKDNFSFVL